MVTFVTTYQLHDIAGYYTGCVFSDVDVSGTSVVGVKGIKEGETAAAAIDNQADLM